MEDQQAGNLTPRRAQDLRDLHWHWGSAYEFTWADGSYQAVRRDTGRPLTAVSVAWLWELVRADYLARPVPGQL